MSVAMVLHDPADAGTGGALRNRALANATADYIGFALDRSESAFLDEAARLLDGDPALAFVTGGSDFAPATIAALCGRSWVSHAPALYRRSSILSAGGFDESLDGAEELDLLLRLVASGARGLVVEQPVRYHRAWGPPPAPNSGMRFDRAGHQLWGKHRALLEAHAAAILVARERIVRRLSDRAISVPARPAW